MNLDRRDFFRAAIAAGASFGLGLRPGPASALSGPPRALRILVLGGTSFLGPYQIRFALERGHTVSMFNRGRTEPTILKNIFGDVEQLIGDRANNLESLRGRDWDAVIDNSGQAAEWATASAELLRGHAKRYLFVSSTGVYYPYDSMDVTESSRVLLDDDPPREPPSYSPMKARSEIEISKVFGEGTILVRPQYIVGPGDPTDRFPHWPVRFARGGDILVPGMKSDPVQLIDVRDLAEFMVRLLEQEASGIYNAAGPATPLNMEGFIDGLRSTLDPAARLTWIEDYAFLREQRLRFSIPWLMPVDDNLGAARINIDRAKRAGLTFRPLAATATDTLTWWQSDAVPAQRRAQPRFTPSAEREIEVLAAWRARGRA